MPVPATPWMRRLPHRPVAPAAVPAPAPARAAAPSTQPPSASTPVRLRPSAPAPPTERAPTATDPVGTGLTRLTPDPPAAAPGRPEQPALLHVPPRGVAGSATLEPDEPVVRLNALQSAIGALVIRGADRVAWEDVEDRGGVVSLTGPGTGDDVPTPGNRPLVEVEDGVVLVTLRHVRSLRRLLIDAAPDTAVSAVPHLGGTVRTADPAARSRTSVVVVDGRLELRAEYGLPDDWRAALTAMGWSPLAAVPR